MTATTCCRSPIWTAPPSRNFQTRRRLPDVSIYGGASVSTCCSTRRTTRHCCSACCLPLHEPDGCYSAGLCILRGGSGCDRYDEQQADDRASLSSPSFLVVPATAGTHERNGSSS